MGTLFCSNCGGSADEGAAFCMHCGQKIETRPAAKVSDSDRKEALRRIAEAVSSRKRTDRMVSSLWIIAPLVILTLVGLTAVALSVSTTLDILDDYNRYEGMPDLQEMFSGLETILTSLQVVYFGAFLMIAKLSYDLILRQQQHFERERSLRQAIMQLVDKTEGRFYYSLPSDAERSRMPLLWPMFIIIPPIVSSLWTYAMLYEFTEWSEHYATIVPLYIVSFLCYIVSLYMLHFLTKEMIGHHGRWCGFTMETKVELARMGYVAGHLRTPLALPDRSSLIYVVGTIFTGGLFAFYWFYVIIKDGNNHFENQRLFEDQLLKLLDKAPDGAP
ncbi:MAG: zinc ribbon domain-containing protein [Methanobacteriota archaeon]|nr:MAG: zinc ribbon domain-containing protein [Euryarchaeota archaeon]